MVTDDLDLQVWPIFHDMTTRGLQLDKSKMYLLRGTILGKIIQLDFPDGMNAASPLSISNWMKKQGFHGKTTKSGQLATDERTLAGYDDPVLNKVVEWRGLQKIINTFIDPSLVLADKNSVIHPKWRLTKVRSGRIACEKPNLLAFPARDEIGLEVRKCFIAREGFKMVSCDFSQIEPRIVAWLSGDTRLLEIFTNNVDLYSSVATDLGVTRPTAKLVTLGVLYGMSPMRLQSQLKMVSIEKSVEFCASLINQWFASYPKVRQLMTDTIRQAKQEAGWASTNEGRKRFLPGLFLQGNRWPNRNMREEAERQAFNHLIQGSAQEQMKRAMLRVDRKVSSALPLLQVHDEMVYEVPEKSRETLSQMISQTMATSLICPPVDLKTAAVIGDSWGDLK